MNRRLADQTRQKKGLPLFCSFALPFVIACIAYAFLGLYPFGDYQLLAHDQWHQYYPFFVSFREKLMSGGSLQYTWDVGMGTGYASLFAYYLASPLNLLSVLVPSAYLREYFALMTVLKFSFAGLFFGVFLRTAFRKNDMSIPFFALMYAFCAWSGGYAWNIIWLDTFALLPLLIAGTVSLLREGRFRMYVLALALSLWTNYYIAFFCCIFVLLCFFGYCIIRWAGFVNFLTRFVRIGLCTLLGVGLAAVLLLPTLLAMETTYSATGEDFHFLALNIVTGATGSIAEGGSLWELLKTETLPGLWKGTRQILSNLLPGRELTSFDQTLPNLYCSFTAVILMIYGFFTKKISLREKLFNLFLVIFLLLSFLIRGLDYIWHGFHFPNMLYFRFSFLFSFVVIAAAYRTFTCLSSIKKWYLFAVFPLSAAFLVNYFFTEEDLNILVVVISTVVILSMLTILLLHDKQRSRKRVAAFGLFLLVSCEMVLCFGMSVAQIGRTTRSIYPKEAPYVQALLNYAREQEGENAFYRTEVTATQTLNDAALNNYKGVSIFTSSANVNFNRYVRALGVSSWPGSNRYCYYESSPFSNTMLGLKYLIDRDGNHLNTDYNLCVASSGDVKLLENTAYISTGFMTGSDFADFIASYVSNNQNDPFEDQNTMFRLASGQDADLYRFLKVQDHSAPEFTSLIEKSEGKFSYSTKEVTEKSSFEITYIADESGLFCGSCNNPSGLDTFKIYVNDSYVCSYNVKARSIFTIGSLQKGDEIRFAFNVKPDYSGTIYTTAARMDDETFRAGLAALADEPWVITEFSDTRICGTVEALEDGFFYTSIPYEPGWRAWVDGEEVSLAEGYDPTSGDVKTSDAVVSFPLTKGSHEILLKYETPGLTVGAWISGICLLIFLALVILLRKHPVLLPDRDSRREYHYVPQDEEDEPVQETPPAADPAMPEFTLEDILLEHAAMDALRAETEPSPEEMPALIPEELRIPDSQQPLPELNSPEAQPEPVAEDLPETDNEDLSQ